MPKGNHNKKKDKADLTPQGRKLNATNLLTRLIRKLGEEACSIDDEGVVLTRFDVLSRIVWDKALGYTEEIPETGVKVTHMPEKSYINLIFDRVEGKVAPVAISDGKKKTTLSERIGEQSKSRLNTLAKHDRTD